MSQIRILEKAKSKKTKGKIFENKPYMVMLQLKIVDFVHYQQINRPILVDLDRLLFHQIVHHNFLLLIIPI